MNVKRCDRCGAVYKYGKGGFVLLADGCDLQANGAYKLTYNGEEVVQQDLCLGCIDDFKQWFERRSSDSIRKKAQKSDDDTIKWEKEVSCLGF